LHYFKIEYDRPQNEVKEKLNTVWLGVQRFLLRTEFYESPKDKVGVEFLRLHSIHPKVYTVHRMTIGIMANIYLTRDDLSVEFEYPNLVISTPAEVFKTRRCEENAFSIGTIGKQLIISATGHNEVYFGRDTIMDVNTSVESGFSISKAIIHLEFRSQLEGLAEFGSTRLS
jgi:hypothetical protein